VFVTCGSCKTEYELDDAKIPAGGARLRCTNCKHSFVVRPPEASDFESADDLAHDAISAAAQHDTDPIAAPRDTDPGLGQHDIDPIAAPRDTDPGLGQHDTDPVAAQEPALDEDPEVEADWQFNEEISSPEPKAKPERPGFSLDMLEPPPDASESPFDQQGDDWGDLSLAEEAVDDLLGSGGPVAADPAAAVDDLLGEMDTERWGAPERDPAPDGKASSKALELADAPAASHPARAVSRAAPAAEASDGFGDVSDWDLFDSTEDSGSAAQSSGSPRGSAAARRDGARAEPQVKIAVPMDASAAASVRWTDRVWAVAGWLAVSGLVVFSLVAGLVPRSSEARAQSGSWSGAGFEADQIVGRWVDNAVAGSLYVVSGRVRRAADSVAGAQNSLGIGLIDANGRAIDRPPVPLAPSIPESVLREASPTEIGALQQRRAFEITAVGERWASFEVVLSDLPRNADRFELQALGR